MALSLPPKSQIKCDAQTVRIVYNELTSVIAGHPKATTTYRFYEELDAWLGPWGDKGYPIAYGKFYNRKFTENEKLMANPVTNKWVRKTTVYLQEALRDYVVDRVRNCTISNLTEQQLRTAAFNSHPKAYDDGGLANVVLYAPELIPYIMVIPSKEFLPSSPNFTPSVKQVFSTLGLVTPKVLGGVLAAVALPAPGVVRKAIRKDQRRFLDEMAVSRELGKLKNLINNGEFDYIPWLDQIIAQLQKRDFSDKGLNRFAVSVIDAARRRKTMIREKIVKSLKESPDVRKRIQMKYPGLFPVKK